MLAPWLHLNWQIDVTAQIQRLLHILVLLNNRYNGWSIVCTFKSYRFSCRTLLTDRQTARDALSDLTAFILHQQGKASVQEETRSPCRLLHAHTPAGKLTLRDAVSAPRPWMIPAMDCPWLWLKQGMSQFPIWANIFFLFRRQLVLVFPPLHVSSYLWAQAHPPSNSIL